MKECEYEVCDRQAVALGLCASHWSQQHLGKPLTPIKPRKRMPIIDGEKLCGQCKTLKPFSEYYKNGRSLRACCKPCARKYQKDWRAARKNGHESNRNAA